MLRGAHATRLSRLVTPANYFVLRQLSPSAGTLSRHTGAGRYPVQDSSWSRGLDSGGLDPGLRRDDGVGRDDAGGVWLIPAIEQSLEAVFQLVHFFAGLITVFFLGLVF